MLVSRAGFRGNRRPRDPLRHAPGRDTSEAGYATFPGSYRTPTRPLLADRDHGHPSPRILVLCTLGFGYCAHRCRNLDARSRFSAPVQRSTKRVVMHLKGNLAVKSYSKLYAP
ncbi:hypothetical protein L0F63_004452 [Massospora cicadina]|nr:hypothetical protein L0F63_004452 [Massospora cicadina]